MAINPIVDAVQGGLKGFGDIALGFIREFHVSPEKAAEIELAFQKQTDSVLNSLLEVDKAQIEVNKEEAKSASLFVAGWRPAIGWICASSLLYVFVVRDLLMWVMAITHAQVIAPPMLVTDSIMELIFAMLGMGGMRSWEKYKGVSRETHK